jgi:YHS domain-containing protein
MRLVLILVWVLVVIGIVYLWMRRVLPPRARTPALPYDELVKDPVCNTYVSRSRAVPHQDAMGLHYFCSAECARRYASLG